MLDRLEDRLLLSADGSFPSAVDTNQDGLFEPFDALILLNAVNSNTDVLDAPHLDLNEDGALSVADVDLIIGSLNAYYGGYWDADSIAALDDSQVSITDVTVAEGEAAEITVSLAQSVTEWTEVMVWSENGTATEYDDFASTYTYLSFSPGDPLSQTVSIPTFVDANDEGDEVFFVRASGSWQTGLEAIGTVIVQDTAFILPTMSVGDVTVTEGQSATITLTLDSAPATEMFVTFWTTEGSAMMYEDYEGLSTDFYWYPGDPLSKTVTLHTYTDSHSEGDETLTVHADIRPSAGSVTPVESTATVTILDDSTGGSGGPTITVGDVTVDEGNPAELTVSVSGPVTESIYLHAWASPGTADTSDYGNVSPTTFRFDPGGPMTVLVNVPTLADGIAESDETFTVHIEDQSTYQGPTATVTILDQDGGDGGGGTTPGFSVSDVTVVEGDMAIVTVTLDAAPTSSLYLDAYTQSVTAYEYEDYDYTSAYLNFNPGDPLTQTISIPTHGDNRNEGDETFEVIVSNGATYQSVTSTVTIQDVAPPTISVSDVTVTEGERASVTVSLSAAPAAPLYLYVSSQSGTATEYEDYEYVASYLTFHPGDPLTQTVEIQTHGDNTAEDNETFEVVVSNSDTYESITGTVTITDIAPPTITVSDTTVLEGEIAIVTVSLSSAPAAPLSLSVNSESTGEINSAQSGIDYEYVYDYLTFEPDGLTTQTIEVTTFTDDETEDDEPFRIVATNNSTYETHFGIVTIAEEPQTCGTHGYETTTGEGGASGSVTGGGEACESDDLPVVSITIDEDDQIAYENGTIEEKKVTFTVRRSAANPGDEVDVSEVLKVKVDIGGTATWDRANSPYDDDSLTNVTDETLWNYVTIPAEKDEVSVVLEAIPDIWDEHPETNDSHEHATLTLLSYTWDDTPYSLGSNNSATAQIKYSTTTVSIKAVDPDVNDLSGDRGKFIVSRTGSIVDGVEVFEGDVEVSLEVEGTAIWNERSRLFEEDDYILTNVFDANTPAYEYVTIPDGQQSIEIEVIPIANYDPDDAETETVDIQVEYYTGTTPYVIDLDSRSATVEIHHENPLNEAVENPEIGQSALLMYTAGARVRWESFAAPGGELLSSYEFPITDDIQELIDSNKGEPGSDSLWDKLQEWAATNWEDVLEMPVSMQQYADMLLPTASLQAVLVGRFEFTIIAEPRGAWYQWDGTDWVPQLNDDDELIDFVGTELTVFQHNEPINDFINLLAIDDENWELVGVIEYFLEMRNAFEAIHTKLTENPIDGRSLLLNHVRTQVGPDVEIYWGSDFAQSAEESP